MERPDILGAEDRDDSIVSDTPASSVSWIRIALLVGGIIALVPLTLAFGLFGFLAALFFLLLAVLAK